MSPAECKTEVDRLMALSKTARYAADRDRARLDANTTALLGVLEALMNPPSRGGF